VEPSARQPALGPDVHDEQPARRASIMRRARRRRPTGEAPPLPRNLNRSGVYWLTLVAVIVALWTFIALGPPPRGDVPHWAGFRLGVTISRADQAVVERVVALRSGPLTHLARGVHAAGSRWVIKVLYWAVVLALVAFRRFRHLFVFLGATLTVIVLTSAAGSLLERPRPFGVQILGSWEGYSQPSRPVAVLTGVLVGTLYALVPQGRWRQLSKWLVVVPVAALGLARLYLAVDSPTDVLVAAVFGVAVPLAAFRLLVPEEVFPVNYRRSRGAHLDVGGARGTAIRRALEDQLGVVVAEVQPFGLAGSAGSTPLKITVKGDPETYLFGKLLASNHLRSDRWYKFGRTLLYGRLEDEKAFNTVRRLAQQEDYALRLLVQAGVGSPEPWGIVEITPEREYLLVFEFFDGAREIGDPAVEVDEGVIDDGLRIIRSLWEAGLAHRDVKPANLLVRDGRVHLIDVFFTEVRPSPWRQAVDLANMMLCLALRSSPQRVYERARRLFSDKEIGEGFAATRGLAMPSQLRRMIRAEGRDLHAEFLKLLPERPTPIAIQRWTSRRVGLLVTALVCALVVVPMAVSILASAGLL
jgi:tRNA A-37 threonylcarbamoyl transferase component Bud32